jgi:hypothetical protein
VLEKAGRFENLQMARRCGPGVREPSRDFSRRHHAAAEMHGEENLSPRWVRERRNNGLERSETLFGAKR